MTQEEKCMGWAKYYEDNVSICIGRMAIKDSFHAIHNQVNNFKTSEIKREVRVYPVAEGKAGVLKTPSKEVMITGRRGLELSFVISPEIRICRKMQMNGWWWSASKKCWCNFNTKVNRRYAEETARRYHAQIIFVAEA